MTADDRRHFDDSITNVHKRSAVVVVGRNYIRMSRHFLFMFVTLCGACLWGAFTNKLRPMMTDLMKQQLTTEETRDNANMNSKRQSRSQAIISLEVKNRSISMTTVVSNQANTANETQATTANNQASKANATVNQHSTPSIQKANSTMSSKSNRTGLMNSTIVVQLHGEMGNHLYGLAQAIAVQQEAQDKYGIKARLVLGHKRGQPEYKWKSSRDNIQKCFPRLRDFDFTGANTNEIDSLASFQNQQLEERNLTTLNDKGKGADEIMPNDALSVWKTLLETPQLNGSASGSITIPFFTVSYFAEWDALDMSFDKIKSFLEFDRQACCREIPETDESVFVSFNTWLCDASYL